MPTNTINDAGLKYVYDKLDNKKIDKADLTKTHVTGNPISITTESAQMASGTIIRLNPIQAGSGTPSSVNVRAISGRDKIEVLSGGKNLFDKSKITKDTRVNASGTAAYQGCDCSDFIPVKPNTAYFFTNMQPSNVMNAVYFYNKAKENTRSTGLGTSGTASVSTSDGEYYVRLNIPDANLNTAQMEEGTTGTTYEPYHLATNILLSLGQIVYGAYLDLEKGVLLGTGTLGDLGDLSWTKDATSLIGRTCFYATVPNIKAGSELLNCSQYTIKRQRTDIDDTEQIAIGNMSNATYVVIRDDSKNNMTVAEFKTAMVGVQLAYELATPFEIQLTPHEISLLSGYNYISTNCDEIDTYYKEHGEVASMEDVGNLVSVVNELGEEVSGINATVNELTQKIITKGVGTEGWIVPLKVGMLIFYGRNNNSKKGMGIVDQTNTFAPIVALDGCTVTVSTANNTVTLVGTTAGEFTVIYP